MGAIHATQPPHLKLPAGLHTVRACEAVRRIVNLYGFYLRFGL